MLGPQIVDVTLEVLEQSEVIREACNKSKLGIEAMDQLPVVFRGYIMVDLAIFQTLSSFVLFIYVAMYRGN